MLGAFYFKSAYFFDLLINTKGIVDSPDEFFRSFSEPVKIGMFISIALLMISAAFGCVSRR